jgi:O-antigen/teichoic acid export membrane protein
MSVLRGLQRYDLYNGVSVGNSLLEAVATVAALLAGWGVLGMIAVNIPVVIVTGFASTWLVRRVAPDLPVSWRGASLAAMRRLGSFSSSVFAIQVAGRLQNKTDEFVIAVFGTLSAVTPYALARKLGGISEVIAVQFFKAVMPLASELEAGTQGRKLQKIYIVASRIALGVNVPIAVVLVVLGGPILAQWVGAAYVDHSGRLVAVLAIASLIATSQWPAVEILQGMARHPIVARTCLAAGAANIGLSILLLPIFGLLGVALGTLIPTAAGSLCVVMPFANRTLHVSWKTALREIWLPSVLPGLVVTAGLCRLYSQVESPSLGMLVGWVVATALVYGVGYLSMPASRAERHLLSDLLMSGSQQLRRLRADPLRLG